MWLIGRGREYRDRVLGGVGTIRCVSNISTFSAEMFVRVSFVLFTVYLVVALQFAWLFPCPVVCLTTYLFTWFHTQICFVCVSTKCNNKDGLGTGLLFTCLSAFPLFLYLPWMPRGTITSSHDFPKRKQRTYRKWTLLFIDRDAHPSVPLYFLRTVFIHYWPRYYSPS